MLSAGALIRSAGSKLVLRRLALTSDKPRTAASYQPSRPAEKFVPRAPNAAPQQKKSTTEDPRYYVQQMKLHNTNQEYAKAIRIWDDMLASGVQPNSFHYSCIFNSLRKSGDYKRARDLALEFLQQNNPPIPAVDRQIFDVFCRSSDMENARKHLEVLKANNIEIGGSILNGYVELCSSSGDLDTAVQVVMDVLVAKIPLVQSSISAVLRGCVSNNDLRNLKRFLKAMRDSEMKEMQPDASCYTALITLLARAGRVDQMERAYEEMRLKELEPSNITFGAMLSCYVDFNNFPKSQEMWSELRRLQEEKGTRIPDHAWNSMLYAHVWQGDIDGAVQLFNEMKENLTLRPNTHSYTALLRLYAQNNDAHSALELFREMETNRVLPQLGTLNALIDCLTRAGNMEAAEEVYKHLEIRQFVPSSDTYYLLIKGYCDQHDLDNAIRVYEACEKAEHVTPTQATLVVLLETLLKLDSGPARATQFLKETVRVYPRSAPGMYRAAISWYMAKGDDNKVAQYKADLQRVTGGSSIPAPTSKPSRAAPSIEEEGYSQQKHLRKTKVAPAKQEAHQEDEEVEPAAPAPVRNQPKQSKPAQIQRQRAPQAAHVSEVPSKKPAPGNSKPAPAPSAPVSSAQARKKVAKIVEQEQSQVEDEPAAPVAEKSKRRPPTPPNHQNQQKKA